jgi:hypothetical protein
MLGNVGVVEQFFGYIFNHPTIGKVIFFTVWGFVNVLGVGGGQR